MTPEPPVPGKAKDAVRDVRRNALQDREAAQPPAPDVADAADETADPGDTPPEYSTWHTGP
jgi:hypothetical protein